MSKIILSLLVALSLGPAASAQTAPPAPKLRARYVVGRATFPDGRPLPEFEVTVLGFDGVTGMIGGKGFLPLLGTGIFHDGTYAVETRNAYSHDKPVDGLVVDVQAKATFVYNGKKYLMRLHPVDGLADWKSNGVKGRESKAGLGRDFVLKIAGLKPGNENLPEVLKAYALQDSRNYYGASLDLDDWDQGSTLRMKLSADARLVVTLVPQGPRMDGSPGQTLTREMPLKALGTDAGHVLDLPIGPYRVQAKIVNGSVITPLLVQVTWGEAVWTEAVTVDFPPFTLSGSSDPSEGVARQTLKLKLPN